jgi:hypothetical protein
MAILAVPLCRCDQRTIESGKEPFERLVASARAALAASACRCDQRTIDETPGSSTGRDGSVLALSARADSSWLAGFVLSGEGCSFSVDTSDRSQQERLPDWTGAIGRRYVRPRLHFVPDSADRR